MNPEGMGLACGRHVWLASSRLHRRPGGRVRFASSEARACSRIRKGGACLRTPGAAREQPGRREPRLVDRRSARRSTRDITLSSTTQTRSRVLPCGSAARFDYTRARGFVLSLARLLPLPRPFDLGLRRRALHLRLLRRAHERQAESMQPHEQRVRPVHSRGASAPREHPAAATSREHQRACNQPSE